MVSSRAIRVQAGEAAEIDGGFRMAGPDHHAAFLGDQGKDMARADEILGTDIRIGKRTDGRAAFLGGDPYSS